MNFKHFASICTVIVLSGTLSAQQTPAPPAGIIVQPGLYDVVVTQTNSAYINENYRTQPPKTQTIQQCLELPDNRVLPRYFNNPGCSIEVDKADQLGVWYQKSCKNGRQELKGRFHLSIGHPLKLMAPEDFATLPGGVSAAKVFSVTGTLGTETKDVRAYQDTEMLYSFAGPCPK